MLTSKNTSAATGALLAVAAVALSSCTALMRSAVTGQLNAALAVVAQPGSDQTQLDPTFYSYRWEGYRTAFVVTPEGVILFDPVNAKVSTAIKAALPTLTKVPRVKVIVYSHNHADHASGAEVFADDHPRIIAQANAAQDIKQRPYAGVVPPTESFEEELTVTLGGDEVRLIHLPTSHTAGLIVAHLPKHRAVVSVDLAHVRMVPPIGAPYTSVHGTLAAIDRIQQLDYDRYIPGHGDIGTKQDVADYRQLIIDTRESLLRQLSKRGVTDLHDGSFTRPDTAAAVMFAAQDDLEPKYGTWRGFQEFALQDSTWALFYGLYMNE